jgi:hypothetical protein
MLLLCTEDYFAAIPRTILNSSRLASVHQIAGEHLAPRSRLSESRGAIVQQSFNAEGHSLRISRRYHYPCRWVHLYVFKVVARHPQAAIANPFTCSGMPPTAVATTGVPQARASRTVLGKVSARAAWR